MRTFSLTVSSPTGHVFRGEAVLLTLRGAEGELAVMAGHVPFMTTVVPGRCKIELEDGTERFGTTNGGLLTVASNNTVTLLSGSFQWSEDEE